MAERRIARMGQPILQEVAERVKDPGEPWVQELVRDMIDTMYAAPGIGLAAPQVFVPYRVIVFHIPPTRQYQEETGEDGHPADGVPVTTLINPAFEPLDPRQDDGQEGCLSIPDLIGQVPRYRRIRYWGTTPDGRVVGGAASGLHARVVQHEIDHLDGVLYPERMTDMSTLAFASELAEIAEAAARSDVGEGDTSDAA